MDNNYLEGSNDHVVGSTTLFVVLSLIASTMLLIALLLWLAELIGSLIGALIIIGGASALIALLLYLVSVRPAVRRMRHEIAVIYEVSRAAYAGYNWVVQLVNLLLK